jgi:hypothetical protein
MNPICATNDECESLVASIDFESGVPSYHSRVYSRMEEENCTVRVRELSPLSSTRHWHWRHVIALKRLAVSFLGLLLASPVSWFSAYRPLSSYPVRHSQPLMHVGAI